MTGLPKLFARIFSSDPDMIELCSWALPIYLGGGIVFGAQTGCQQSFMALGQARISLIMACLRKVVLIAPFIYIFPATVAKFPFAAAASESVSHMVEYPAEVFAILFCRAGVGYHGGHVYVHCILSVLPEEAMPSGSGKKRLRGLKKYVKMKIRREGAKGFDPLRALRRICILRDGEGRMQMDTVDGHRK